MLFNYANIWHMTIKELDELKFDFVLKLQENSIFDKDVMLIGSEYEYANGV